MPRKTAAVFCLLLVLAGVICPAQAKTKYMQSGAKKYEKLSRQEITDLLQMTEVTIPPKKLYNKTPSIKSPYKNGSLNSTYQKQLLARFNALRKIAGLPSVKIDSDYTKKVQAGVVLEAALDELTTQAQKRPKGMSKTFFKTANEGLAHSTLSYDTKFPNLIDRLFNEAGENNITTQGHRRWMLNPTMGKTGFGFAYAADGRGLYSGLYAHDSSAKAPNYDFIAWPVSGYFPADTTVFEAGSPWTVTVNPKLYKTPSIKKVKVTLKESATGRTWTFKDPAKKQDLKNGSYYIFNDEGYGVKNCIVFRPAGIETYSGTYTVKITGLQTAKGKSATISYQVKFFDTKDYQ